MCAAVTSPLEKKLHFDIVGWGDNAKNRVGNPCDPSSQWSNRFNLNIHGHIVNPVTMAQFYGKSHALLHYYPFIESFGFATLQAMLAKCVPVGAAEGGFLDLLRHGDTGYLARCPEEAAYYTSKLAFEDATWRKMSEAAAKWVVEEGPGNPDKCWPWWEQLLKSREISF
jgi:glycosyltransferase involved in cell wall biosynthesis